MCLSNNGVVFEFGQLWGKLSAPGVQQIVTVPWPVQGLPGPTVSISAGGSFSVAVVGGPRGAVYSWGFGDKGCLGLADTEHRAEPTLVTQLECEEEDKVVSVSCGDLHTLALHKSGHVSSWGCGQLGQLGRKVHAIPGTAIVEPILRIPNLTGVIQVTCGHRHSVAVDCFGAMMTWGEGSEGRLGHGSDSPCPVPTHVSLPGFVLTASAGRYHTLVTTSTGALWAFGCGEFGQIGSGFSNSYLPVKVDMGSAPQSAGGAVGADGQWHASTMASAAGAFHSLLLADTGEVATLGGDFARGLPLPAQPPSFVDTTAATDDVDGEDDEEEVEDGGWGEEGAAEEDTDDADDEDDAGMFSPLVHNNNNLLLGV